MRVAKQRSVKELEALRRQSLADNVRYKTIAVGPPKYLYWRFENVKGVVRENWQFRYKHPVGGQAMKVGLGSCADVTLAEARERGTELLRIYNQGLCPKTEMARRDRERKAQAVKVVRFKDFYRSALEIITADIESKGRAQHYSTIEQYVLPFFGDRFVGEIDVNDVAEMFMQPARNNVTGETGPFWQVSNETATRVRGRLEKVFRHWANLPPQATGYTNPAHKDNGIETLLPKVRREKKHHPWLHWRKMPAYYDWLKEQDSASANCLRCLIFLPARSAEIRLMKWDEIDFDENRWHLEIGRMKTRKKFVQPLPRQALDLIKSQPRLDEHVWKTGGLSSNALSKIVERYVEKCGDKFVIHGARSSYLTWAADHNFDFTHADMNLAHKQDPLTQAYQRSDLFDQRLDVLQAYADYVTGERS